MVHDADGKYQSTFCIYAVGCGRYMMQMENIRAHLASMQSAMEVIVEILKMKETIQRQVVVLLYVWWSERCAIREGDNPRSISYLC